jgi:hypothetical protein
MLVSRVQPASTMKLQLSSTHVSRGFMSSSETNLAETNERGCGENGCTEPNDRQAVHVTVER